MCRTEFGNVRFIVKTTVSFANLGAHPKSTICLVVWLNKVPNNPTSWLFFSILCR